MTHTAHSAVAPSRIITNPVLKDEVTFLETVRESHGQHTLVEVSLSAGGGTQLHYHNDFTEEFTCLEGELNLQLGRQIIQLIPGQSATAPIRRPHRFFNQSSQPCRFQCRIAPGHSGFEQALQISYGLARQGRVNAQGVPKNLYALGYLVLISGSNLTGIMALVQPLLNWLGRRARKNGVAAELQRRYLAVW